jgi:plasmid stability protein
LAAGSGLLTDAGIRAIEAGIASYVGEYLPIWDEVERQTTGGRGSAGDLVRAVRTLTEDLHLRLLLRLARHYRARRDNPRAIPLFEEVLRSRPERQDVAQLLIAEYRDTGQTVRAQQLETTYRLQTAGMKRTD